MLGNYGVTELKKGLNHPSLLLYEAIRVIDESTVGKVNNWIFDRNHSDRIDVMSEDWDNLILLDACRYDYFSEMVSMDGSLRKVVSKGGSSWPFIEENFVGRELHDTVYVTANLHAEKLDDDIFYTIETIPSSERNPERVREAAKRTHEAYPNKRLIVHFMQPHRPYLGPTADRIRAEADSLHLVETPSVGDGSETHSKPKIALSLFKSGSYPLEDLHQMYAENLSIVLEEVDTLLDHLDGKSVISSDHGELLGERKGIFRQRKFGHPDQINTSEAYIVPWFEIESDNRRDIVADDPIGFERLDEDVVRQRLEELGYIDAVP